MPGLPTASLARSPGAASSTPARQCLSSGPGCNSPGLSGPGHKVSDMSVTILEKVWSMDPMVLAVREEISIRKLNSKYSEWNEIEQKLVATSFFVPSGDLCYQLVLVIFSRKFWINFHRSLQCLNSRKTKYIDL